MFLCHFRNARWLRFNRVKLACDVGLHTVLRGCAKLISILAPRMCKTLQCWQGRALREVERGEKRQDMDVDMDMGVGLEQVSGLGVDEQREAESY